MRFTTSETTRKSEAKLILGNSNPGGLRVWRPPNPGTRVWLCPSGGRPVSTAYTPPPSVEYLIMSEIRDIEKVANSYIVM